MGFICKPAGAWSCSKTFLLYSMIWCNPANGNALPTHSMFVLLISFYDRYFLFYYVLQAWYLAVVLCYCKEQLQLKYGLPEIIELYLLKIFCSVLIYVYYCTLDVIPNHCLNIINYSISKYIVYLLPTMF